MFSAFIVLLTIAIGSISSSSNDKLLLELGNLEDCDGKFKRNSVDDIIAALRSAITEGIKAELREKRVHLDTDMVRDMVKENSKLRDEIAQLRKEVREKRYLLNSETDWLTEITKLRDEIAQLRKGRGTIYVRWGKRDCPRVNGTAMIYRGYMGGKHYNQKGAGTNHLCLPDNPTWGSYTDGVKNERGFIYGTEFQEANTLMFGKNVYDQDVPCAVCKVPGISVMIPARAHCYPGWNLEYRGYLMSDRYDFGASEYVCVDARPDVLVGGVKNTDGNLLYIVESICGALKCPPYHDRRELACVVCSI